MKHILALLALACGVAVAADTPPSTVIVKTDPSVKTTVIKRTGNTSKQIIITVNKHDTVTIETVKPTEPPPDHSAHGPYINDAMIPKPAAGFADKRWQRIPEGCDQANPNPSTCNVSVWIAGPSDIGAFRTVCDVAMFVRDDPIVLPGKPGKSHMHMVFGNTGFNANSTQETLSGSGNSTCRGGTLFRSAMWVPAVVDEKGALIPFEFNYYQKGSYAFDISPTVQPMPAGMRMVIGDAMNTDPAKSAGRFMCENSSGASQWLPTMKRAVDTGRCTPGGTMRYEIAFDYCWDGKNLDSADHRSHVSAPAQLQQPPFTWKCPATHPVTLPVVSYQMAATIPAGAQPAKWRLASDLDPTKEAGASAHGDYWANIDAELEAVVARECIKAKRDGKSHLTCDGRTFY